MKAYVLYVVDESGDVALGVFSSKAAAWKAWDKFLDEETQQALTYRIEEWEIDGKFVDYEGEMFYYD